MSQYSYPATSTANPFGAAAGSGSAATSSPGQTVTPTPTSIPPLAGVGTTRDSQSPNSLTPNLNSLPQTTPQANQTASPVPTVPPVSSSFNPDTSNPYALYSSYNFGSYPTNVQAKSEPLA